LAEENHHVCVDQGAAGAGHGDEVQPRELLVAGGLGDDHLFVLDRHLHNEELLPGLSALDTADALPYLVGVERLALVHEETWGLREEEHAEEHNGGEDEGGAEDIAPVAGNMQEHGGDGVTEDLAEGDVELVERNEVTTNSALDGLCDVDGDGTTLESDTHTENYTSSDDHTCVSVSICSPRLHLD
jgi:hypothetical protein